MSGPVIAMRAAWGEDAPDWVVTLAEACASSSQNKVALQLGASAARISQILRAKYPGDMHSAEMLVRGKLMAGTVDCPAMGTMPSHECLEWQRKARKFSSANMERVRMYRACNNCPRVKGDTP